MEAIYCGGNELIFCVCKICGNSLFFDPSVNRIYDYADAMVDLKSLQVKLIYKYVKVQPFDVLGIYEVFLSYLCS